MSSGYGYTVQSSKPENCILWGKQNKFPADYRESKMHNLPQILNFCSYNNISQE